MNTSSLRRLAPLVNVALRTGTLGTRFALVFILAKYLKAASVGYYGLFTASIGYALLCVGFDFYTYTTREIAKVGRERQGAVLRGQLTLLLMLYVILVPVILLVLFRTNMPYYLIWWFVPILILEHLNQELYRLLIILSRQIEASVLLFIRQGSWAVAAAGFLAVSERTRSLNFIMLLWASAGIIAAIAGIWTIFRLRLSGWRTPVDWGWIKRGVLVSSSFLTATLAVRAVQTLDRYWLERLVGIDVVGAYVLFFGVASALSVFLDAAIFSFYYPRLVHLAHEGRTADLHANVRRTGWLTAGACVGFALVSSLLLPVLLRWIGRSVYLDHIDLYYWVLGAMIVYSIGMVPHYALYARGRDRPIIVSHLASLLVFAATTLAMTTISHIYAVPVGVLAAMSTVMLWKAGFYLWAERPGAGSTSRCNLEGGFT